MIFKFTNGTEYVVFSDSDFKHMIGYYLENDLTFLAKEEIITDDSCIDLLKISNTTKNHIKKLFTYCVEKSIKTISICDLKQYCMSNNLQYQSMYLLFRRVFNSNFIKELNNLYKKYTLN